MQERPVLLVSDRPERAERLGRGIALIMPCRVVASEARIPGLRPVAWVIDVDLERVADTPWFAELCARVSRDAACIVLARGTGTREATTLARLGAPTVVPARVQGDGIVTILIRAIEQARAHPLRVARGLGTATGAVESLFTCAAAGRPPRPNEAEAGTQIVLDLVSEVGIRDWLDLVRAHHIGVYAHSLSVAGFAAAFAAELGLSRRDRHRLTQAALLHDIGKARIPVAILDKPGPLDADELRVMREHPAIGAALLAEAGGFEPDILDVVRHHHERLDGGGYPDGLVGGAIGDLVRLVAICDVHSALTERRAYRPPLSATEAMRLMDGMAGQLDPDLLHAYGPIVARAATCAA